MAKNKGTLVASAITTFTTDDKFPTAFADEIQGGLHIATDSTARNAIPPLRRKIGMHCQVIGDKEYVLDADAGNALTVDADWSVFAPTASDVKTADGNSVETAVTALKTAAYNKQAIFAIMHTDVKSGVFANEFCSPFKGSAGTLFASVPASTVLTKDIDLQIEYFNGSIWAVVDSITIPMGSASMYTSKAIATPQALNSLDRLRVNILSVQDGIESLNVYVGIKATN